MDDSLKTPVSLLRSLYVESTPKQTYGAGKDRIAHASGTSPDRLAAAVSALEGFARRLVTDRLARDGIHTDAWFAYPEVKSKAPLELVERFLCLEGVGRDGIDDELWGQVKEAIEFRNVIVHEAAYLNKGQCDELTDAVVKMFEWLGRISGVVTDA